ncbi:MAG: TetR/AcrR family transcriptional regulator [Pirellulaceae bacterium]
MHEPWGSFFMTVGKSRKSARRGTGRKPDFLPLIADAFVENGYRRTTTAALAETCGVRENELYRIWPNKKAMFLDAIQYVFDTVTADWSKSIDDDQPDTPVEQLIDWQSQHRGDSRLHRILFSGLSEVDDPEIRKALRNLYRQFHQVLEEYIREHRQQQGQSPALGNAESAWAMIGLGSIFDIAHELGLGNKSQRREILQAATTAILNMTNDAPVSAKRKKTVNNHSKRNR